jgi:Low-density lipoprotein receptor domain class A
MAPTTSIKLLRFFTLITFRNLETEEYALIAHAGSHTCQPHEFRCDNGQCVHLEGLCSGRYICNDGSFEISSEICG